MLTHNRQQLGAESAALSRGQLLARQEVTKDESHLVARNVPTRPKQRKNGCIGAKNIFFLTSLESH